MQTVTCPYMRDVTSIMTIMIMTSTLIKPERKFVHL